MVMNPANPAGPSVTVLMTMFNAAAHLRAAVASILGQTFGDFEFVIVDDGSTDASAAIVESFGDARIRLVRNERNNGQTPCLNQGLVLARGTWVARQDADDISLPRRLERQVAFLRAHPGVALLGTAARQIDGEGRALGVQTPPADPWAIRWMNLFDNSFFHSAVMIRTAVVREELGGYDESFRCSQDYALWSRLARRHAVANFAEPLIALRVHAASMMRSQTSLLEDETGRILRANCAAEFPGRTFTGEEHALLAAYRWQIAPERLAPFHALLAELRAAFLAAHPEARDAVDAALGRQSARIAYNLLPQHRTAALREYAHGLRAWPGIFAAQPWARILALLVLGDSARARYRRLSPAK